MYIFIQGFYLALITNFFNDLQKQEEDINRLLQTFPSECPPHLKINKPQRRFTICGEILTDDDFLLKWNTYLNSNEIKRKKSNMIRE
jgi:hypothetical protein